MPDIKDTRQAKVRIGFDGRVYKHYYGAMARARFDNERRVLKYLEARECPFVPRVLDADPEEPMLVTSNCGNIVDKISQPKLDALFAELEEGYGVRHEDPFARNVTYSARMGRFCLIDFEFATILESGQGLTVDEVSQFRRDEQRKQLDE